MTKNNKPVLSILIDKDKRERFAEFARRKNLSMGYLVNQAIDRMLEGEASIEAINPIYRQSVATDGVNSPIETISRSDVEKLIKTYIENLVGDVNSVGAIDSLHKTLNRENIEEIIETFIDKDRERVDELVKSYGENKEITSIAIEDLRAELSAVSELSRNLHGEIVKVKQALSNRVDTDTSVNPAHAKLSPNGEAEAGNIKTWGEFFKMVGIEALPAVEAQKKENIDIRTKQIEMGLQAVREKGLGEWAVKVSGRSFVRANPPHPSL